MITVLIDPNHYIWAFEFNLKDVRNIYYTRADGYNKNYKRRYDKGAIKMEIQ